MKYKFLSLFSGGLDSFVASYIHKQTGKGLALYIKMYPNNDPLLKTANELANAIGMEFTARECYLDFAKSGNYIPQRNLIFLAIAYHVAELHSIPIIVTGLGTLDERNKYPDTSQVFVEEASKIAMTFTTCENLIQVVNPVVGFDKKALLRLSKKFGILNLALKTSSCYSKFQKENEWGRGCGNCTHCATRIEAYKHFRKKNRS